MAELDVPSFLEAQVSAVKEVLGNEKTLVAVSGGVDSTVSAIITHKAIGDNLICVFIDDNFMRLGEAERVKNILSSEPINLPVRIVNKRQFFMESLEGLIDAEEKRRAFRKAFYDTLSEVAEQEKCKYLVQGTIKADIDETSGGIKTQHNILEQIGIDPVERFGFKVIEPIKSLYKYQVREVARYLKTPLELSERQPFPGPGLSVRVVGLITPEKLDEIKKATFIVEEVFRPIGPSQYFAAIFDTKTSKEFKVLKRDITDMIDTKEIHVEVSMLSEKATGILNNNRAYGSVITVAFLDHSGSPVELDYSLLKEILVYLNENYPEATRLLFLVDKRDKEGYTVAMRAIKTRDFLTADIMEIPWHVLRDAANKIMASCINVSSIYYDVTPKPPATIEFE